MHSNICHALFFYHSGPLTWLYMYYRYYCYFCTLQFRKSHCSQWLNGLMLYFIAILTLLYVYFKAILSLFSKVFSSTPIISLFYYYFRTIPTLFYVYFKAILGLFSKVFSPSSQFYSCFITILRLLSACFIFNLFHSCYFNTIFSSSCIDIGNTLFTILKLF